MNRKPVISFDFDGVFVLDSDTVFKPEAWHVTFGDYIGRYEFFLREAQLMFGYGKPGGRVEIIRYVLKRLGESGDGLNAAVERISRAFDDYVQAKILEAGLAQGALETLEELIRRGAALYLNSGTATAALHASAHNLKIDRFFDGIFGSTSEPAGGGKVENLHHIAKREGILPSEILVIGDGESDYNAAQELGCKFIGVSNKWNRWDKLQKPFPVVIDLQEVLQFIKSGI